MPTYIIEVRMQIEAENLQRAEEIADRLDDTAIDLLGVEPTVYVDGVRPITSAKESSY